MSARRNVAQYEFANLCGASYKQGNVLFGPDGTTLFSPVGNRVTVFDLASASSHTLPAENRSDVKTLALTPDGALLLSVDARGGCVLTNVPKRTVLHHFSFKGPVHDIQVRATSCCCWWRCRWCWCWC